MTLASRLSTQVKNIQFNPQYYTNNQIIEFLKMHVKKIYDSKTKLRAALGNIAIIQVITSINEQISF